jgi:8-oxo-dGTP diphosphatase
MYKAFGLIIPYRPPGDLKPTFVFADLPIMSQEGLYLFFDLIINTGETVLESLRATVRLTGQDAKSVSNLHVVSPFATEAALKIIQNQFPNVTIHTLWNKLERGRNGWLIGLNFDAGDFACGGGARIREITHMGIDITAQKLNNNGVDSIYKVGALIFDDNSRVLVVRKVKPGQEKYIVPGGKAEGSEQPLQTLMRELREELGVELVDAEYFGRFHEIATFEQVPLLMDIYIAKVQGKPSPQSEIKEYIWIDRQYHDHGILLGNALENEIVPELIKRGIW